MVHACTRFLQELYLHIPIHNRQGSFLHKVYAQGARPPGISLIHTPHKGSFRTSIPHLTTSSSRSESPSSTLTKLSSSSFPIFRILNKDAEHLPIFFCCIFYLINPYPHQSRFPYWRCTSNILDLFLPIILLFHLISASPSFLIQNFYPSSI